MQNLEKILEEIDREIEERRKDPEMRDVDICYGLNRAKEIIRRHMNDGWIPVEERLPEDERANYEVTFINECGYEEHGFAQWYDGEFHIPAVVIAWREHLEPYRPEPLETRKELEEDSKGERENETFTSRNIEAV